jgi:DNA (cytosine-5)-methyltransferase 1
MDGEITFGSLFAGIGGFDLGFERAGMVCKWQVEIDDYANRVLAKHWPHVHRERDIRECGSHNLEAVDVICGGFPCQDISYSGLGAGLEGQRSGLFFEAIRLVRELRPRVVVLENVAALLTRGLDRVLGTLAEIGFDAEWHCIPAAAVGAPHSRDRTFIIAYCNGDGELLGPIIGEMEWMRSVRQWDQAEHGFGTVSKALRAGRLGDFSGVPRVAHGVPAGLDRLRGPGNAVVPQVAEFIGGKIIRAIVEYESDDPRENGWIGGDGLP